jgi:hypothetical protein
MKIYTYRGEMPNFGDELNNWLLPKVFPNLFDDDDSRLFLGIGSILFDHHPPRSEKRCAGRSPASRRTSARSCCWCR